jgi:hypothetical protein
LKRPVIIIIDGLDECRGDAPQEELITLIHAFARTSQNARRSILWVIASRPEWHIVSTFSRVDSTSSPCQKEILDIHDKESCMDVSRVLRSGFQEIRRRHPEAFGGLDKSAPWPTEDQLLVIESTASGLFVFGDTVLKFIGDEEVGDPISQLDVCLQFLKGSRVPLGENPLDPLASLYRGILGTVDRRVLQNTLAVLYCLAFNLLPYGPSVYVSASLNALSLGAFYACLRRLHSVVCFSPSSDSDHMEKIGVHHRSFSEFLQGGFQSGEIALLEDIQGRLKARALRWYQIWQNSGDDPSESILEGF